MTSKASKATSKARAPRGAGSLVERPGHPDTWRLRYREGGRSRETTFTGSRSAAAAQLRELSALAGNAPPVAQEAETKTVGELLDVWLVHIEGVKAPSYVAENRRVVDIRLRPALGAVRIDQLTPKHMDDVYREWSREGLTGATIRRYAAPLRTALGQARRCGWLETNSAHWSVQPRPVKTPKW